MADHTTHCEEVGDSPDAYGPWNPGISADLSPRLWSLCTIFRAENTFTTFDEAVELRDATGLELSELAIFRPERLILHEMLIRVISDFEVPDPQNAQINSLGINFRRMTRTILARHIVPRMHEFACEYQPMRTTMSRYVHDELASVLDAPSKEGSVSSEGGLLVGLRRLFGRTTPALPHPDRDGEWKRDEQLVRTLMANAQTREDPMRSVACQALAKVISAVRSKNGHLWGEKALLGTLATGLACNAYGSEAMGQLIEPHIHDAAKSEGYRRLPSQARPVVMSIKGASASGKSTMRPIQRELATRIGVPWSDFSLISPDILRRDLLDFESLGSDYKYAGAFTSHELEIIDRKLDRHMAHRARRGMTPHLLIDRFRFDSFVPKSHEHKQLLARLGNPRLIHFLFMITPPHKIVERAWERGLEVGRYKPVDDLLGHSVDAYSGMRGFFFARALQPDNVVHYEFLDNDVPRGELPLTVAFGWSGEMNILDVNCILNIDRYRKINVSARNPLEVYPDRSAMAATNNVEFFAQCVQRFPVLNVADRNTGRVYARTESATLVWADPAALLSAKIDEETRAVVAAVIPDVLRGERRWNREPPPLLVPERFHTLGRWGKSL